MPSSQGSAGARRLFDEPEVLRVLFHPREEPDIGRRQMPDLEVPVEPGVRLAAKVFPAEAASPVILLFHGNGELASDYAGLAPHYNRAGASLVVFDYRGYGFSQGTPTSSNLLHDARAVFHAAPGLLAELGMAAERIFAMGRSLGSAAAIEIAATVRHKLAGLIVESGFAHTFPLVARLGGPVHSRADEKADGFANLAKMEQVTVPLLVIHGQADQLIPVAEGQALHRHARVHDKRLLVVPRAGHNDLLARDPDAYFTAIRDFVA